MLKDTNFCHLRENNKKILNTGIDSLKAVSKIVAHTAGRFLEDKTADILT